MTHLKLIPGSPTPAAGVKRRLRRQPKPASMLSCHRCGGREVVETRSGVMMVEGKPTRGTKILLCAACYMRGERVVLL